MAPLVRYFIDFLNISKIDHAQKDMKSEPVHAVYMCSSISSAFQDTERLTYCGVGFHRHRSIAQSLA